MNQADRLLAFAATAALLAPACKKTPKPTETSALSRQQPGAAQEPPATPAATTTAPSARTGALAAGQFSVRFVPRVLFDMGKTLGGLTPAGMMASYPSENEMRQAALKALGMTSGASIAFDRPAGFLLKDVAGAIGGSPQMALFFSTTTDAARAADLPASADGKTFDLPAAARPLTVGQAVVGGLLLASNKDYLSRTKTFAAGELARPADDRLVLDLDVKKTLEVASPLLRSQAGSNPATAQALDTLAMADTLEASLGYKGGTVNLLLDVVPAAGSVMAKDFAGSTGLPASSFAHDYPMVMVGALPAPLLAVVHKAISEGVTDPKDRDRALGLFDLWTGEIEVGVDLSDDKHPLVVATVGVSDDGAVRKELAAAVMSEGKSTYVANARAYTDGAATLQADHFAETKPTSGEPPANGWIVCTPGPASRCVVAVASDVERAWKELGATLAATLHGTGRPIDGRPGVAKVIKALGGVPSAVLDFNVRGLGSAGKGEPFSTMSLAVARAGDHLQAALEIEGVGTHR